MTKSISIGHILTRDAMKNLKGGTLTCNATPKPGYHQELPGSCEGTVEACNAACASWCSQTAGCASCSCS